MPAELTFFFFIIHQLLLLSVISIINSSQQILFLGSLIPDMRKCSSCNKPQDITLGWLSFRPLFIWETNAKSYNCWKIKVPLLTSVYSKEWFLEHNIFKHKGKTALECLLMSLIGQTKSKLVSLYWTSAERQEGPSWFSPSCLQSTEWISVYNLNVSGFLF